MSVLSRLFRRRGVDREIDRELQFHLDQQITDYVAAGLTRDEAARRARLEFGGRQQIKEQIREASAFAALDTLWNDVRYSARTLKRSPGFAAAAMLALAFGSGGTTALATILNDLVVRPPRIFRNANELVVIGNTSPLDPSAIGGVPLPVFEQWHAARALEQIAAIRDSSFLVRVDGNLEAVSGQAVSPNLLDTLGASPFLGRGFGPGDDRPEASPVALISYGFWQLRLAGDANILGRNMEIAGRSHAIIGILPRGYALAYAGEGVMVPLSQDRTGARDAGEQLIVGRLRPGVRIDEVRAELLALQRVAEQGMATRGPGWGVRVDPMRGRSGLGARGMALVFPLFFAAVLLTLVATSANLAILMVARGMARVRESAVRAALGASRYRLMQQVLLEALLLAAGGGAVGVLVAVGLSRFLISISPGAVPPEFEVRLDLQMFGFAALIVAIAGVASGAAPALAAARTDVVDTLKGVVLPGRRQRRLRGTLVVVEMAVAMVMLVCVGLFISAYARALDFNPGFEWKNLLTVRIDDGYLSAEPGRMPDRLSDRDIAARLQAVPGVTAATVASIVPPLRGGEVHSFSVREDAAPPIRASGTLADVDASFFGTIGLKTLRGRAFEAADPALSEQVVISEAVARRYWSRSDPLGGFIQIEGEPGARQIVAVVADVQRHSDANRGPMLYMYRPRTQRSENAAGPRRRGGTYVLLRTASDPAALAPQVRLAVREIFPDRPMPAPATLEQMITRAANEMMLAAFMITPMVLLALLLSASGIYGLIAQQVLLRTRELGIRAALGAERRQLVGLVLRDGLKLARTGVVAGLAGVLVINRIVMSMFVGVTWAKPSVLLLCALLMAVVSLAASYRPASRAARVDPMTALRYE